MKIHIALIEEINLNVFKNLAYAYEAEFSGITEKIPNELGLFSIDTLPKDPYIGYILYKNYIPIGFCIANTKIKIKDIAEFYIIPAMRCKGFGYQLAAMIFDKYPGQWQVRQIPGADHAISFWRKVIAKYTEGQYEESVVNDKDWGMVTCQSFSTSSER
ncbi:MAG: hypothetical protein HRU35_07795 [Rickettsiaceae bacterium]|nr:hypothetical protein [Rickettsiaceae bacterium]